MVERNLIWSDAAKSKLEDLYKYIQKDSPKNAQKVRSELICMLKKTLRNPAHFAVDEYSLIKKDNYRYFEKYNYRVSFFVTESEITVLRIRHTKMNPTKY